MYINKCIVFGNLTRDPEMRALPSGGSVASFSIATNRTFKKGDGSKAEQTEFHNIVVFGKQADNVGTFLKKGGSALVEGRLQTRSWEAEGKKQYKTEIVAEHVEFGPRKERADAPVGAPAADEGLEYPTEDINPDDIPF